MPDNHATFESDTKNTPAVLARATKPGPGSNGVHAITNSAADSAVYGEHTDAGIGVFGRGGPNGGEGVFGQTASGSSGVYGKSTAGGAGVTGVSQSAAPGVQGVSDSGPGVSGQGPLAGVSGSSDRGDGVSGKSSEGFGMSGTSSQSHGVNGLSFGQGGAAGVSGVNFSSAAEGANGVAGLSVEGNGVVGITTNIEATGIYGSNFGGGYAGEFDSDVFVDGGVWTNFVEAYSRVDAHTMGVDTITSYPGFPAKGRIDIPETVFMAVLLCPLKLFRIDHPQDPANKYLNHGCVESSEFKNVYDGTAVLDEQGEAVVRLPEWFDALNDNFRYQLTSLGAAAPELHISQQISGNQFRVSGGRGGLEVCWQVTGVRKDKAAQANPVVVEQDKPAHERGFYLHPQLHGESQERGIHRAGERAGAQRAEETRRDRFEKGKEFIAAQRQSLAAYRRQVEEHARSADGAPE